MTNQKLFPARFPELPTDAQTTAVFPAVNMGKTEVIQLQGWWTNRKMLDKGKPSGPYFKAMPPDETRGEINYETLQKAAEGFVSDAEKAVKLGRLVTEIRGYDVEWCEFYNWERRVADAVHLLTPQGFWSLTSHAQITYFKRKYPDARFYLALDPLEQRIAVCNDGDVVGAIMPHRNPTDPSDHPWFSTPANAPVSKGGGAGYRRPKRRVTRPKPKKYIDPDLLAAIDRATAAAPESIPQSRDYYQFLLDLVDYSRSKYSAWFHDFQSIFPATREALSDRRDKAPVDTGPPGLVEFHGPTWHYWVINTRDHLTQFKKALLTQPGIRLELDYQSWLSLTGRQPPD